MHLCGEMIFYAFCAEWKKKWWHVKLITNKVHVNNKTLQKIACWRGRSMILFTLTKNNTIDQEKSPRSIIIFFVDAIKSYIDSNHATIALLFFQFWWFVRVYMYRVLLGQEFLWNIYENMDVERYSISKYLSDLIFACFLFGSSIL